MEVKIQMIIPYITFHGNCKQALDYYTEVFGNSCSDVYYYGDYVPEGLSEPPQGLSGWVMHAEMDICGNQFWFADEIESVVTGNNVKLTLTVCTASEAKRIYEALSNDGEVSLPPTETFYSNFHAALRDRFGLCWNIVSEEAPEHTEGEN